MIEQLSLRGSRFSANAETTAQAVEGILVANGGVIFDAIRTVRVDGRLVTVGHYRDLANSPSVGAGRLQSAAVQLQPKW